MEENNILNNPDVFAQPAELPEKEEVPLRTQAEEASEEIKENTEARPFPVPEVTLPEWFVETDAPAPEEIPLSSDAEEPENKVTFIEADAAAEDTETAEGSAESGTNASETESADITVSFIDGDEPAEDAETSDDASESGTNASEAEGAEATVTFIEADEPAEDAETAEGQEAAAENGPVHVEQLSLLEDQLPHLEAANAPNARKAKAVLEGLLFLVGDEGITAEQAGATLDITPELAAEYFDDLMKVYLEEDRGIEIANYGGTYRFLSKAVVHEYARKLFQVSKQATLSQAALETLAIIAYKQPITRVEIEEIRGVGADMMLRKLMARDLIRESGRSEAAGRPILYEVTDEFMNSFKLMSLKELPELPQFNESEESEDLFNQ